MMFSSFVIAVMEALGSVIQIVTVGILHLSFINDTFRHCRLKHLLWECLVCHMSLPIRAVDRPKHQSDLDRKWAER